MRVKAGANEGEGAVARRIATEAGVVHEVHGRVPRSAGRLS